MMRDNIYAIGKTDYFVLVGKAGSPQKIENLKKFQKELIKACSEANKTYGNDLYAKLEVIKGPNEIRCVLYRIDYIYEIISVITRLSSNYMKFVLVYDHIEKGLNSKEVSQMEGTAFNKAFNLMKSLEKNNLMFEMDLGNVIINKTIVSEIKIIEKLITNNINLILLLKSKWRPIKVKIINEYKKTKNQKIIAQKLNLKQQVVSYNLNSSNWKELNKIENDLNESLNFISMNIKT